MGHSLIIMTDLWLVVHGSRGAKQPEKKGNSENQQAGDEKDLPFPAQKEKGPHSTIRFIRRRGTRIIF